MISQHLIIEAIKCILGASLFFVWVIRYENIKKEFKDYGYPDWLRDFVGILKIIFFLFILSSHTTLQIVGSLGIASLMLAAIITHIKMKNILFKMLPSLSLMFISLTMLFMIL